MKKIFITISKKFNNDVFKNDIIFTCPCAIAPTTIAIGSSLGTNSLGFFIVFELKDINSFLQPTGR